MPDSIQSQDEVFIPTEAQEVLISAIADEGESREEIMETALMGLIKTPSEEQFIFPEVHDE